jgi:nitrogen PTS system EIIA component
MTTNGNIKFSSLFTSEHVICHTPITERDAILKEILKLLAYQHGIGNVNDVYNAVLEREKSSCTILGKDIVMPHARLDTINEIIIGIATSTKGINFGCRDAEKAKMVILILVPKANPSEYLQVLSSLTKICKGENIADNVSSLTNPEQVWKFFDREGILLPDYICAGDIMEKCNAVLNKTDTLEQAIDTFVKYNRANLPVVDKDYDLIGVVSSLQLLHVCLPEYILWMEDLTPIIHFEPFIQILRNESKTWLTDIMETEYITVNEDTPAIQVAKEMARQNTSEIFVVRNKKLTGVINLLNFINKILRY